MMVYVARTAALGDCTNGGVSATNDILYVEGLPDSPRIGEDAYPHMVLESHHRGCVRLRPAGEHRHVMFGGNYAGCSDSRFGKAIERLLGHVFYGAVPIHDRVE
jgi:hypothetical protein